MHRVTTYALASLAATAMLVAACPTVAVAGVFDYGAIASCGYKVVRSHNGVWTRALLNEIAIDHPTIVKTDKSANQTVGWRFIVERSLSGHVGPWNVTYRSPVQRALKSAGLTSMQVAVTVPPADATPNGRDAVWYRVILKLFWYRPDGAVLNKVSHQMTDLNLTVASEEILTDSHCPGLVTPIV